MNSPLVIKVTLSGRELQTLAFDKPTIVIGRDPKADIFLDNPGVSRRHAAIEQADDALYVRDLHSSNGTRLNGQPVRETRVSKGDVIGVFKFDLHVLNLQSPKGTDHDAPVLPPDPTYQSPTH